MTASEAGGTTVTAGATLALAEFVAGMSCQSLPEPVVDKARALLLDFVGVALGGTRVPEVATILGLMRSRDGLPTATVLGTDFRTTPADAAYCNGCAADVLEHQDGYRFGGFHPSHTLPALLAVAELEDRSLPELLTAIVAAYEVANRIGRAVHPRATAAGWFPMVAGFGAAAGCAKLLGLGSSGIASAMGAAAFFIPTVMLESIFGGYTVKPAFAGQLARAGVEGALHAQAGLTGWPEVLESPRGFVALLGGSAGVPSLTEDLGERWTVLDVHQKRLAGCRHTHGAAQACLEVATEHDLDPGSIVDVDVETYEVARTLVNRAVGVGDSAIPCTLSLPYVAAVAVVDRNVSGAQYSQARITDPMVHQVASKIRIRVSDEMDARYPEYTATRVTISTADGQRYQRLVDVPAGDSRAPLSRADLLHKFHGYARSSIGDQAAEHVVDVLFAPSGTSSVRDLTTLLTA